MVLFTILEAGGKNNVQRSFPRHLCSVFDALYDTVDKGLQSSDLVSSLSCIVFNGD